MSPPLTELTWPVERLEEATEALALACGMGGVRLERRQPPGRDDAALDGYLTEVAAACGLELNALTFSYAQTEHFVASLGPALLRLPGTDGFLLVLEGGRKRVTVLSVLGHLVSVKSSVLASALRAPLEAKAGPTVDALLSRAKLSDAAKARARQLILTEQLSGAQVPGGWHARLPAGAPFVSQLRRGGVLRQAGELLAAHVANYLLVLVGWWLLGRGVLSGHVDRGWLWAWALVMLAALPLRLLALGTQGRLAVSGGVLLRRRLLAGILKLEPDRVRAEGVGRLLGRVLEAEAVEALALEGGFAALLACVELFVALLVISLGASGPVHALIMACGVFAALLQARAMHRAQQRSADAKVAVTQELVEGMVGHRTRLVQEQASRRHVREDVLVRDDLERGRSVDRHAVRLTALAPRVMLGLGLFGLGPAFFAGQVPPAQLAISIGGVLLASAAIRRLVGGLTSLSGARVAFQSVAEMFDAASRTERAGVARVGAPKAGAPLLVAEGLGFRHPRRGEPVLRGVELMIRPGDKLLLEGPSGGGKSTLGAVLAGLRKPERGLLLLHGLDLGALGSVAWRSRVAMAPQFHENHIFSGTFSFNLLMGRTWPPSQADLQEADALCRELELGPLLDRMPGGLEQMVGETGWQLSHGERSRVFLARALLQGAEVVVLDESFAALDPATLEKSIACVLRRAATVLVIAHP